MPITGPKKLHKHNLSGEGRETEEVVCERFTKSIKIPITLWNEIKKVVENGYCMNSSEFIRLACINQLFFFNTKIFVQE